MNEHTKNVVVRGGIPSQGGAPIPSQALHDIRGDYVEVKWLPVIGPTATLLARRLVGLLDGTDPIDVSTLAHGLGVGRSRFWQALDRLQRFGLAGVNVLPDHDLTIIYLLRRWPDAPQYQRQRDRNKEAAS